MATERPRWYGDNNLPQPENLVDKDDNTAYVFPTGGTGSGGNFAPPAPVSMATPEQINAQAAVPAQAAAMQITEERNPASIESAYNVPVPQTQATTYQPSSSDYYQQGINAEINVANKQGQVEQLAYNQMALDTKAYQEQEAAIRKREEDLRSKFDQDYNKMSEEVNSKKIDSRKWWKDKSTGDKVLTMVGLALSSLNNDSFKSAMGAIDKTIERDINDQKADIEQGRQKLADTKTLYGENLRRFGDQRVALASSKLMNAEVIKNKLAGQLAGMKGEVARANGLKFMGQVEQYALKQKAEIAKIMNEQAKETRGLEVAGFTGKAPSETDARAMRSMSATSKGTLGSLKELEEITKTPFKSLSPTLRTRGAQLSQDIQLSLKEIKELGVLSGDDSKRLDDYITNPTDFFSNDTQSLTRIKGARELISRAMTLKAESLGLKPLSQTVSSFKAN